MTQQPAEPAEPKTLEMAAAGHVSGLEFAPGKHTFGITRAGLDLAELIEEHGAVVVCRQAGGLRVSWQVVARIALEVYTLGDSYADSWAAQYALEAHLASGWKPTQGVMRIDSWRNESAAAPVLYPGFSLLVSTWRISSRDLP